MSKSIILQLVHLDELTRTQTTCVLCKIIGIKYNIACNMMIYCQYPDGSPLVLEDVITPNFITNHFIKCYPGSDSYTCKMDDPMKYVMREKTYANSVYKDESQSLAVAKCFIKAIFGEGYYAVPVLVSN